MGTYIAQENKRTARARSKRLQGLGGATTTVVAGGTSVPVSDNNYENATNKPKINGVELFGDKSARQLKLAPESPSFDCAISQSTTQDQFNKYFNAIISGIPIIVCSSPATQESDAGVYACAGEYESGVTPKIILTWITKTGVVYKAVIVANQNPSISELVDMSELEDCVKYDDLATVATTGSYNDLTNKPVFAYFFDSTLNVLFTTTAFDELKAAITSKIPIFVKGPSSGQSGDVAIYACGAEYIATSNSIYLSWCTNEPKIMRAKLNGGQLPIIIANADLTALSEFVKSSQLADVAFSGSFDDLINVPEITEQVQSDWDEDDNSKKAFIKNKPNLANFELVSRKVTEITQNSTNLQYPGAKAVYDFVSGLGDKVFICTPSTLYNTALSEYEAGKMLFAIDASNHLYTLCGVGVPAANTLVFCSMYKELVVESGDQINLYLRVLGNNNQWTNSAINLTQMQSDIASKMSKGTWTHTVGKVLKTKENGQLEESDVNASSIITAVEDVDYYLNQFITRDGHTIKLDIASMYGRGLEKIKEVITESPYLCCELDGYNYAFVKLSSSTQEGYNEWSEINAFTTTHHIFTVEGPEAVGDDVYSLTDGSLSVISTIKVITNQYAWALEEKTGYSYVNFFNSWNVCTLVLAGYRFTSMGVITAKRIRFAVTNNDDLNILFLPGQNTDLSSYNSAYFVCNGVRTEITKGQIVSMKNDLGENPENRIYELQFISSGGSTPVFYIYRIC